MAAGGNNNVSNVDKNRILPSQELAALPQEHAAAPALEQIEGDEFYGDGIDESPPEPASAQGRTVWIWVIAFLLIMSSMFTFGALSQRSSTKPLPVGPITESPDAVAGTVVVHVTGQVKSPGVYKLPFEARINDAIAKAGGALPDADLNAVNLAAWAEDGARIEVPAKAAARIEVPAKAAAPRVVQAPVPVAEPLPEPARSTPERNEAVDAPSPIVPKPVKRAEIAPRTTKATKAKKDDVPRAITASGAESTNASPEFLEKNPIDLNTATAEQLQMLPGIGPAMAEKILTYRQENGGFKDVDDLDNVRGIGAKTMEKLRPWITVK